jgi:hypothetical protein
MMNQVEFLQTVWSDQPPGFIQLWRLAGRASFYLRSPIAGAAYAGTDVYTGVCLAGKNHGRKRRCPADQAVAIPGLWADIDINGGPDEKTGAAPNLQAAISLAHAIQPPTLLVNSGYGVQAWWLLPQPWAFATQRDQDHAATLATQWQLLHRRHANEAGHGLDHTHDLARLLRLPGTMNGKGGHQAPVTVLEHTGRRYTLTELDAIASTAGPVNRQLNTSDLVTGGAPVDVEIRASGVNPQLFQALIANSPEFGDVWHHKPRPGTKNWSNHEYDLSLCSLAVQAGWTDQQLADLIVAHRARWDQAGHKARRLDYLQRTISRARSAGERASALTKLQQLARTPKEKPA